MKNKACPSIGVYFSHYECFGHTSRVIAIGEVFKKRFSLENLFFIEGGPNQPYSRLNEFGRIYHLPFSYVGRQNFKEEVRIPRNVVHERSRIITEIIQREKPDILITEFFPLGRDEARYELIPALIKASHQGVKLWAVAGYPLLTGFDDHWRRKILELYSRVMIFSPDIEKDFVSNVIRTVEQKKKYLNFFKENSRKITFAGYLLPQNAVVYDDKGANIPKSCGASHACKVTVVRGGGAYYSKLIAQAILASDILGKDYYFTVIVGPATTTDEWYFFSTLAGKKKVKNLVLYRSVGDYEELISRCDVCVSVASYNTAVMLLKHCKKAVVIPFEGYKNSDLFFSEQPARARLLNKYLGAEVVSIDELSSSRLAEAIEMVRFCRKGPGVPQSWFKGKQALERALAEHFAH